MGAANAGSHVNDMMSVPMQGNEGKTLTRMQYKATCSTPQKQITLAMLADLEPGPRSCKIYLLCQLISPAMAKRSSTGAHHPLAQAALVMALAMALAVQETQAQCPSNDLASCLPAAKADIQPTEECCTNLAAYTATDTPGECICEGALSSAGDDDVNMQFAVLIPQKCALLYPAGTTCRGYVIPGGQ